MIKLPQDNDFDMKISPDNSVKTETEAEKASQKQIDLFLEQRNLGNMEKAQQLGDMFFDMLQHLESIAAPHHANQETLSHQLQLLYCYVVHKVTQEHSPNSIVAQKTLSHFYERLADSKPILFQAMNGNMSFSMYLYLNRSKEESPDSIGRVFAQLCGIPDSGECKKIGASCYLKFMKTCSEMVVNIPYIL